MKIKTMETERLILRDFKAEDAHDLEESKVIIENLSLKNYIYFAIVLKATEKVIGAIGLEADIKRPHVKCMELAYSLGEDFWEKDLLQEVSLKVMDYGFMKLKLDRIAAYENPGYKRSGKVIEKCGFTFEGTLRGARENYDGTIEDVNCYSITRKEYKSIKNDKQESYAYLLRCADNSLYCGFTTALAARVDVHNAGIGAKYTKSRRPVELVYYETFKTCSQGRKREVEIKKLTKEQKEKLVKNFKLL